ncbi:hypothetical protein ASPWEDRAFT_235243 [Aspergillus wentii DTO 134E9]|uniref:Uncharacterized protein n=1 Tax=Aspergillus wentii DTO 134E9 TaxID=1073089 RepID=A0A1L9S110_ASPWE|nr:uncharacterized protein ASPWEDRAFT_235243 [Aspergillus wentii DTO 134E9]OJJ40823.1 hypothetical protein ASPWEDRAFT_235243 [Aspergillus wentii DTO 134E9]
MGSRQLTHDAYSVGWVCVLDTEMDAARALLDEEDESLDPGAGDDNSYTLGRMGRHNVVIVAPDSYGTNPAAQTVTNMLRTFPKIRFGLMVGVGGGAPKEPDLEDTRKDIRLGDVVVSEPRGSHGGVLQYDMGKWKDDQIKIESHLNKPPGILLKAMKKLRADHRFKKGKMQEYIRDFAEIAKDLPELAGCQFPGRESDLLFEAGYAHLPGTDCSNCDAEHIMKRLPRESYVVHYGLIASGNAVIRSAQRRDELRDAWDVLCFEMEAAGLMNSFPCIVIRGICDYSDGHKNKRWQPYAAVVAAAYAKDLLRVVLPQQIEETDTAARIIGNFTDAICRMEQGISTIETRAMDGKRDEILNWLTPVDYELEQSNIFSRHEPGTGRWLLDSEEYQAWASQTMQTLFCPGIPGAGKTVLSSIIISHLDSQFGNDSDVGIAFVYCSYRTGSQHKPADVLLGILGQLARKRQTIPEDIVGVYENYKRKGTRPTTEKIAGMLESISNLYTKVFIIVDALDEYYHLNMEGFSQLLSQLFRLQAKTSFNLLATSRFINEITSRFDGCIWKEILAQDSDILCFLNARIPKLLQSQISKHLDVQEKIRSNILKSANGMFLLVRLHIDSLSGEVTVGDLEIASAKLPRGERRLDETYRQAMRRIRNQPEGHQQFASEILSWLTYSKRALSLTEIQHALAVRPEMAELDSRFIPDSGILGSICAGLVTMNQNSATIHLVHYTVKEYFERTAQFPDAEDTISKTCIRYLSFQIFDTGFCSTDDEFEIRLRNNSLYAYSAQYWGYHKSTSHETDLLAVQLLENKPKVAAAIQAMFVSEQDLKPPTYSQKVPKNATGMHLAAYFGRIDLMEMLLLQRNDPDLKDSKWRTPLSWAADNGHITAVKFLLTSEGVNPNSMDTSGYTPLARATLHGYRDAVEALLWDNRVNPDPKDSFGRTPLSRAAEKGHEDIVQLLVAKSNVNAGSEDRFGQTPLWWALRMGRRSIVNILLALHTKKSSDVEIHLWMALQRNSKLALKALLDSEHVNLNCPGVNGLTPLWWSLKNGYLDIMEMLLSRSRVDVNSRDLHGNTPLSWAVSSGNITTVELLLAVDNIDIYAEDWVGSSPLSIAVKNRYDKIVELLLQKSDDLDSQYVENLLSVAAKNLHKNVIRLLLERAADKECGDLSEENLPAAAVRNSDVKIVKALLEKFGDTNVRSLLSVVVDNGHEGISSLLLEKTSNIYPIFSQKFLIAAVGNDHEGIVRAFLNNGVEIDSEDSQNLLSIAIDNGYTEIVRVIIGSDIDIGPEFGQTLLSSAVNNAHEGILRLLLGRIVGIDSRFSQFLLSTAIRNGHEDIVRLLLDKGCDIYSEDHFGENPLSVAVAKGYESIIVLMLESAELDSDNELDHATHFNDLLINQSIDLNTWSQHGQPLLSFAARKGDQRMFKILLNMGAMFDSRDQHNQALLLMAIHNDNEAEIGALLKKCVDLTFTDDHDTTLLSITARRGYEEIVKLLLKKGMDPNIDTKGKFEFEFQMSPKRNMILKMLFEYGAHPNVRWMGNLLRQAAIREGIETVQILA